MSYRTQQPRGPSDDLFTDQDFIVTGRANRTWDSLFFVVGLRGVSDYFYTEQEREKSKTKNV